MLCGYRLGTWVCKGMTGEGVDWVIVLQWSGGDQRVGGHEKEWTKFRWVHPSNSNLWAGINTTRQNGGWIDSKFSKYVKRCIEITLKKHQRVGRKTKGRAWKHWTQSSAFRVMSWYILEGSCVHSGVWMGSAEDRIQVARI